MGKIDNVRRILTEDYKEDERSLISRLGFTLNRFMEQVVNITNGNIGFDNLNREISIFNITVDANGVPIGNNLVKTSTTSGIVGFNVINARNITNIGTYPTGSIQIFATININLIKINKITGLQANNKYEITAEIIGS